MTAHDKQWASKYLLDPLNAPEPSQETGPGTHYNSTFDPLPSHQPTASSSGETPRSSVHAPDTIANRQNEYPSPSKAASSRRDKPPSRRQGAYSAFRGDPDVSNRLSQVSTQIPTSTGGSTRGQHSQHSQHRNGSPPSRFNGDPSYRPLEMIKRDTKLANRAPHLRKKNHVGPDAIDSLDNIGPGAYHHEGPYDATLLARNTSSAFSPVEAVRASNEEALKATPKEKIQDSIEKHRPLDGVAIVPPGLTDSMGRKYEYEEGADMMIENGGNYKRWPGVQYHPDDLKGKGEPSYSIEKALKEHKNYRRSIADGESGIEMAPRRPMSSGSEARPTSDRQNYSEWGGNMRRSSSLRGAGGSLRKRIGSLGRKDR